MSALLNSPEVTISESESALSAKSVHTNKGFDSGATLLSAYMHASITYNICTSKIKKYIENISKNIEVKKKICYKKTVQLDINEQIALFFALLYFCTAPLCTLYYLVSIFIFW